MADNLTTQTTVATIPDASTIATDDVAGVHYQRVKLVDGTADGTGLIAGDATNGLDVDVTRLPALVAGTANIGDVDVLTVPSPLSSAGGGTEAAALRVTLANDSTGLVSVDDNAGSLTVDAADGTVFVRSNASGTFPVSIPASATNLSKAEDAASATADVGVPSMAVRKATPANTSDLDGDYEMLQMSAGRLWASTVLEAGGTVTANQGTAGTAWEAVGDVATDIALGTNNPVVVGGRASTAVPTAVSADGDAVNEWVTRQGAPVVTMAPHVGIFGSQPWNLTGETAQYTTTQTSTVLVAGGVSERLVVTSIQIQAGGTTAGTLQVYFGTGAYVRGTNLAIFDGEFAPSATLKPGVVMTGPFISATNGDDILVTTSAAINPLTITVWYYVVT